MSSPKAKDGKEDERSSRQGAELAIDLAIESKWEEAVTLNRSIIETQPKDVSTWNRLGKALQELGRYREAYDAYGKSVEIDPVNSIATRNIERLEGMQNKKKAPRREAVAKVAQDLFIEEVGKSGSTVLRGTPRELLAALTAGDEVYIKPEDDVLQIHNVNGDVLGSVEPKLGLRLLRLIQGGNQYAAAVKSVSDADVEIIMKETYRDPSQTRLSFPAVSAGDSARPNAKESLLRRGADDDDDELIDDDSDGDDWDSGDSNASLSRMRVADTEDDQEDE